MCQFVYFAWVDVWVVLSGPWVFGRELVDGFLVLLDLFEGVLDGHVFGFGVDSAFVLGAWGEVLEGWVERGEAVEGEGLVAVPAEDLETWRVVVFFEELVDVDSCFFELGAVLVSSAVLVVYAEDFEVLDAAARALAAVLGDGLLA